MTGPVGEKLLKRETTVNMISRRHHVLECNLKIIIIFSIGFSVLHSSGSEHIILFLIIAVLFCINKT
jgi:hypothetical protein